tara:strand:+ start:224 stop:562 length:339 start_codon:yes stop_codon:yes gene_type:complete
MKTIVETKGDFMLVDPYTGDVIEDTRPSVVTFSPFIETRVANGQVKALATDLPEEANDADFVEYWKEKPDMAVDAYASEFAAEEEPEPKSKPKGKPAAKGKAEPKGSEDKKD